MGRLDYFLIWDHGIKYRYEILSIIRAEFEILGIHRRKLGSVPDFVRDIYASDTVPFKHLVIKTRYLLKIGPNIIFILVRNDNPDEQMVGAGAFRHIQCMRVNGVKKEIRGFNPPGTEHHVVHASDYESQTKHAMKLLGVRCGVASKKGVLRTAKLDDLRANIIGVGLVEIKDTPHYAYVTEGRLYAKYYDKHMGTRLTDDHTPEAFDRLIENFKYRNPIRVNKNRIIDGVHRAAIFKSRGVYEIEVEDTGI